MNDWKKEFDEMFVRDDDLMDKYAYDMNGNLIPTAEAIKFFFEAKLQAAREEGYEKGLRAQMLSEGKQAYEEGLKRALEIVEEMKVQTFTESAVRWNKNISAVAKKIQKELTQ